MRAYVFWHRPRPGTDLRAYEVALRDFHEALGRAGAVEGFIASESHRLDGAPWLPGDAPAPAFPESWNPILVRRVRVVG